MKTLEFSNGDQMPALGLGTWKSEPQAVYHAVKHAIKAGYRHIDCAWIYGNEDEIGQALEESFAEGTVKREDLWITSKLWNSFHKPEHVEEAIKLSLKALRIDYLDLYLMHWPVAHKEGVFLPKGAADLVSLEDCPVSATWGAMEDLVKQGLCRHIGVSNFSVTKLKKLTEAAAHKPEMNQLEMHPYLQQLDMVAFCRANGIHLTAYSPLGSPDRPARLKDEDEPVLLEEPLIATIAERLKVSPAQVLLGWSLKRGNAVIPKSVNPVRMEQNFEARNIEVSDEDCTAIEKLNRGRRYVNGSAWVVDGGPYTIENLWDE